MTPLIRAMEEGDCQTFGDFLSRQLMSTISFFDYGESYYHGFLAGLLSAGDRYITFSNRETGLGRADLILQESVFGGRGVILELKVAPSANQMELYCRKALVQIEKKNYESVLRQEGCREILKYGVCFYKKGCMVMQAK